MPKGIHNLSTANRFRLSFTGNYFWNNNFELIVTGVAVPGLTAGVYEQPTPMRTIPRPGGSILHDDLIVTFLVSENYAEWLEIFNWIRSNNHASEIKMTEHFSQGQLFITSNKHNPTFCFEFLNIFPYMLSAVDLSTEMASNEVLTATASFRFHDMNVKSVS